MVWAGLVLYVASAGVWLGVLSRWEVSKAYPLVGLGFVLTLGVGWALGEQVGALRVAGVVLIAAGVVLVSQS
jgi:drug/metabolite transporter (DMT)-like permease